VPYIIALVELDDQVDLRLTSNLITPAVGDIWIGMPVRVVFARQGRHYIPMFESRDPEV
jgi:hypothetical protein